MTGSEWRESISRERAITTVPFNRRLLTQIFLSALRGTIIVQIIIKYIILGPRATVANGCQIVYATITACVHWCHYARFMIRARFRDFAGRCVTGGWENAHKEGAFRACLGETLPRGVRYTNRSRRNFLARMYRLRLIRGNRLWIVFIMTFIRSVHSSAGARARLGWVRSISPSISLVTHPALPLERLLYSWCQVQKPVVIYVRRNQLRINNILLISLSMLRHFLPVFSFPSK